MKRKKERYRVGKSEIGMVISSSGSSVGSRDLMIGRAMSSSVLMVDGPAWARSLQRNLE